MSSAFFLPSSAKKREGDLTAALSRASSLETQLNKSEASLTTALSQNASLTSELMDVNGQLAKVCIARPFCFSKKSGKLSHVCLVSNQRDQSLTTVKSDPPTCAHFEKQFLHLGV